MKFSIALFAGFAILFFMLHSFAGGGVIRVRERADIGQSRIHLGDIAAFENIAPNDTEALSALEFGQSPEPGTTRKITNVEIGRMVRKYSRLFTGLQFVLPDEIEITRRGVVVDKSTIREVIQNALSDAGITLGVPSDWKIKVTGVQTASNVRIEPGAHLHMVALTERPRGHGSFQIEVTKRDEVIQKFWAQANVRYSAQVPVATHQLRNGQNIDAQKDVRWEERDVTFLQDTPVNKEELSALPAVALVLAPGAVILHSHLSREIAARRGEEIELISGNDEFRVSTRGVSETQGYVGDLIRVRNPVTGKIFSGTLTSKGVVKVNY